MGKVKAGVEFNIEFTGVSPQEQEQIKAALQDLNPPKDCIEDFSFTVRYENNRYWLGYRQMNGPPGIPVATDLSTPIEIAAALRKLSSDCW